MLSQSGILVARLHTTPDAHEFRTVVLQGSADVYRLHTSAGSSLCIARRVVMSPSVGNERHMREIEGSRRVLIVAFLVPGQLTRHDKMLNQEADELHTVMALDATYSTSLRLHRDLVVGAPVSELTVLMFVVGTRPRHAFAT